MTIKEIEQIRRIRETALLPMPDRTMFKSQEAEGGCGVIGLISTRPMKGKCVLQSSLQMHNRGNGKGGGIAACGLSAKQLGVSEEVLQSHYIIQVAYLDPSVRSDVENQFIYSKLDVAQAAALPAVEDFHEIKGLAVKPPEVWRYFARVKPKDLETFRNQFGNIPERAAEDEFIYQNSRQLNHKFYASLGEKRAFVLSHGRNLIVLKIVGYAEEVVTYYRLEDFEANLWIAHQRYPTKGKVWHPGGAHPFIGLNEALIHNGDFANYHSICEVLKQRGIHPLFLTDTEVAVLLFISGTVFMNTLSSTSLTLLRQPPKGIMTFCLLKNKKSTGLFRPFIYMDLQMAHGSLSSEGVFPKPARYSSSESPILPCYGPKYLP